MSKRFVWLLVGLMQGDPFTLADLGPKGMLMEYEPGTASLYPHPAAFGKWVQPHGRTFVGPIYNPALVSPEDEKKIQTDWKFLTDPKWKGKLAASVPEAGGTSYGPTYMFIRQAFPPPTPVVYMGMAIPKNAPHPNAAKLYMEWSFSKKGQELMTKICAAASARSDLKLDPYSRYDWYKPPTETFTPASLTDYIGKMKDIQKQWHDLTGVK